MNHHGIAYCVSTDNFVRLAPSVLDQEAGSKGTAVGVISAARSLHDAEVVMTGLDHQTSVVATRLNIEAQTSQLVHEMPVWRTLVGGKFQCENCASVVIAPVPTGTKRLYFNAQLPAGAKEALLYLVSVVV